MTVHTASVIGAAACIIAAGILWVQGKHWAPRVTLVLLIAGSATLTATGLGDWLHRRANHLDTVLASYAGQWTGLAITCLLSAALLLMIITGCHRGVDKTTLLAGVLLPPMLLVVPEPVGPVLQTAVRLPAALVTFIVAAPAGLA